MYEHDDIIIYQTEDGLTKIDTKEQIDYIYYMREPIEPDYLDFGSEVHVDMYDNRLEIYSPGGMYDGSIVQNLDTDRIPSRRNPIIADIFNRMNYMERRGSGFKKIKGGPMSIH